MIPNDAREELSREFDCTALEVDRRRTVLLDFSTDARLGLAGKDECRR